MGEGDSATADLHRVLAPLPMRGGRAGSATVLQSVRSALRALGAYRMHSVLTMLGIAFGVAALLFMVELNQVSQEYVSAQWAHIGANLVSVFYRPAPGASKALVLTQSTLTLGDVQALQRLPHVTAVSPVGYDGLPVIAGPITSGGWPIEAGFASLQMLQELSMQHGAFFTDQDEASGAAVAAIGPEVASHFFPGVANPVGRQFRIGAVNFQVVGVVGMQGGVPGDDFTDLTYIPFNTYKQRLSGHNPPQLLVQVDQGANIQSVMTAIDHALAQQHRLAAGQPPDFDVSYYNASADPEVQQLHLARLVMIIVAAVLLLIGGFGIASTAFLAVQQRRREIGLRLAVGAHPSDVQRQFLTEASVLSLAGALLGIIIGFALVLAFFLAFRGASLGHHFRQAVQAHPVPSPLGISLALAVCLFLGITAGYLPARRAARLNPIDALR